MWQLEEEPSEYPKATAAKRGRNANWPWVPIVNLGPRARGVKTWQVRGKAFATRDEAVTCAERAIEHVRAKRERMLLDPRQRALREAYGLPREINK